MQREVSIYASPSPADRSVCAKWLRKACGQNLISVETLDERLEAVRQASRVHELYGLVAGLPELLDPSELTPEERNSVFVDKPAERSAQPRARPSRRHCWRDNWSGSSIDGVLDSFFDRLF